MVPANAGTMQIISSKAGLENSNLDWVIRICFHHFKDTAGSSTARQRSCQSNVIADIEYTIIIRIVDKLVGCISVQCNIIVVIVERVTNLDQVFVCIEDE